MNTMYMTVSILVLSNVIIEAYDTRVIPFFNRQLSFSRSIPLAKLVTQFKPSMVRKHCYVNNVFVECLPIYPMGLTTNLRRNLQNVPENLQREGSSAFERSGHIVLNSELRPLLHQVVNPWPNKDNMNTLHGRLDIRKAIEDTEDPLSMSSALRSEKLNMKLSTFSSELNNPYQESTESLMNHLSSQLPMPSRRRIAPAVDIATVTESTAVPNSTTESVSRNVTILEKFALSLDKFERNFYATTFSKLRSISPASRRENGMSYVQSGLFLQLSLMALSTEVNQETRREIDDCLGLNESNQERIDQINSTMSSLPISSDDLKFRWSSRLVLQSQNVSDEFVANAAKALRLQIDWFNGTETPKEMTETLNSMVEIDSSGAIHNTFEEEDMAEGARAVLINMLYLRARWRSAPTLLNGTRPFCDFGDAPQRTTRMIRVNDIMRYADLVEWDAEALEIFYSTPGLSLLMLVPRGTSLKRLADEASRTSLEDILAKMQQVRVAATLPLYTLRMTLLLPNKLEAMNITRLVDSSNGTQDDFRLSHAVQRIMFWAEAGRNAFKDDGIEWDETPQRELVVDRPYIFYVRWKNKTLMNGNFVL